MRITTIIVVALILTGAGGLRSQAQPLSEARPPAEIPPASFRGKQYVDSRGCIYIRAGIDGNVTWVPRVDRQRQQICGYQPSLSPEQRQAAAAAPRPTQGEPELITLEPSARPRAQAVPSGPATPPPAAAAAPQAAPARTPSPAPKPTVFGGATSAPKPKPAPPAAQPRQIAGAPGALPADTRVLRRHVAEARAGSGNIRVPRGYEPAWSDDRLNPRRSEMTLKPSQIAPRVVIPRGYRTAWEDDRLNPRRAPQGSAGEAAMDALWTREVPRQLAPSLGRDRGIRHSDPAIRGNSPFWQPPAATSAAPVTRLSSRSAPLPAAPSFIRVATYQSEADAKQTARALAQRGLPMRMGRLKRGNEIYPLVLSGPFDTASDAQAALARLKAAGFPQAVLLR